MQTFKVNGQSVPKIEWKQTDRQTEAIAPLVALMRWTMNEFSGRKLEQFTNVFSVYRTNTLHTASQ